MRLSAHRLLAFRRERFPLRIYATYAVLWVLALEGSLTLVSPGLRWELGPHLVIEIASVLLALLFIRVVDEQKDLAYDQVHNPGRPLPRGAVSVADLRLVMIGCVVAVVGLNLPMSPLLAGWLLLDLGYICFLVWLERHSAPVRDGLFLNLLVSYPAQLLLSGYVWLAFLDRNGVGPSWAAGLVVVMLALVFLHFEVARKTSWTRRDTANLYSNVVGPRGSAALALACALGAAGIALLSFEPWRVEGVAAFASWLPLSAVGFLWMGGERFLSRAVPVWPPSPPMGFLAWFYFGLFVQALATQPIGWSG